MAKQRFARKHVLQGTDGQPFAVRWEWSDGSKTTVGLGDVQDLLAHLAVHGLSQKLGDAYSSAESLAQAKGLFDKVLDGLRAGNWSVRGESDGGLIVQAIAAAMSWDEETARTRFAVMDDKAKKKVSAHPAVQRELRRLQLARLEARAADADDLTALFGDEDEDEEDEDK